MNTKQRVCYVAKIIRKHNGKTYISTTALCYLTRVPLAPFDLGELDADGV